MSDHPAAADKTIRFLIMSDPLYDRRIRNFISFFQADGWRVELFHHAAESSDISIPGLAHCEHIKTTAKTGVARFLAYHYSLTKAIERAGPCRVTIACDVFSLRAATLCKREGELVIYDAREVYTQLPTVERRPLVRTFWRIWERQALARTDLVLVTAPLDADSIRSVHGTIPPHLVIKNMPSRVQPDVKAQSIRDRFQIPTDTKILVYVGGLQPGRGLEATVRIMRKVDNAVLVLIGHGAIEKRLRGIHDDLGLGDKVLFYGSADADAVLGILRGADVGISLIERSSGSYRLALPSKDFEYLYAGLPVVSSPLEQVQSCLAGRAYVFYADESNQQEIVNAINDALEYAAGSGVHEAIASAARRDFVFENDADALLEELRRRAVI